MNQPKDLTHIILTIFGLLFCVCLFTCQGREHKMIVPQSKIDSLKIDTLKK